MNIAAGEPQGSVTELSDPRAAPSVLVRQAIIDDKLSIFGYELVQRLGQSAAPDPDAESLLYLLTMGPGKAIAERRVLFVRCAPKLLESDHLDLIDPERLILEVALPATTDAAGIEHGAACLEQARKRGFRLAFNHMALAPAWASWRAQASFLRIELSKLPAGVGPQLVKFARRQAGLQLIACGVDTAAQYEEATALGIKLFQGSWFAKPLPVTNLAMRPGLANILQLINLVRAESDTAEIEAVLKRDPALSFNLLRFINSAGFNLSCEVTSFRHAVMILGLKKLFRWAALLLATARAGAPPAVMHMAVVRGRLMELLATEVGSEDADNAFVAGVFSMLDAMTGIPMATAVDGLALPDTVVQCLLERSGPLMPFLEMTQACETAEDAAFAKAVANLQLSSRIVNMAHLDALSWAADLLA